MSAICRSCGASIIWAITKNGKRIPLDAKPEVRMVLEEHEDTPVARSVEAFTAHFASCPNAAQHRKKTTPAEQASVKEPAKP